MLAIEAYRASIGNFYARVIPSAIEKHKYSNYGHRFFFNFGENLKKSMFRINLVLFLILNLHFTILNFSKLILEGVESNPGPNPNVFTKTLLATRHQGHEKYGDSAGWQCTALVYFSIIFSFIKIPSRWAVFNLDYILDEGYQIYKSTGITTA